MGTKRKKQSSVVPRKKKASTPISSPANPVVPLSDGGEHDDRVGDESAKVIAILMAQGLGEALDEERARSLVDQTRSSDLEADPEAWAEACLLALACDNEIDDEVADVALAMSDSLRAAELAARTSTALENEPPDVLLERFTSKGSQVASYLVDRGNVLEQKELHELLELELRCAKWWPIASQTFFRELVDGLRGANIDQARSKLLELLDLIRCVTDTPARWSLHRRHDSLPIPCLPTP